MTHPDPGPPSFERVDAQLVARAATFSSSLISDAFGRRGTLPPSLRPLSDAMAVCGPAYTVALPAGDNLMFHYALTLARRGDVIVVQSLGTPDCALFGELMTTQAQAAGLRGLVVDGPCRDVASLRGSRMPVFATGSHPRAPTRERAGTLGQPLRIGDVTVQPGDLVVGDADGVVVVPRAEVEQVLEAAQAKSRVEAARLAEIADGRLAPAWLGDALRRAGLSVHPQVAG